MAPEPRELRAMARRLEGLVMLLEPEPDSAGVVSRMREEISRLRRWAEHMEGPRAG